MANKSENELKGTLYIVATPIGNLEDITLRAIKVLKSVALIGCEDTRHSLKLLNHLDIHTPLISCRAQNETIAAKKMIEALQQGKDVAYISDAGTPSVSDPGARLCNLVREANITVTPIPGASALISLVSVSSITGKSFTFLGFLTPKGSKRKKILQDYMQKEDSIIIYESPYRIIKLIRDIADIDNNRMIFVGRELTKSHEEILEGEAEKILNLLSTRDSIKGEFVIQISGKKNVKVFENSSDSTDEEG